MKRVPVVATLVVVIAVGIMIRLGFWQLARMHEKEALLARYAAARMNSEVIRDVSPASAAQVYLYRRIEFDCARIMGWRFVSGRNAKGESGIAVVAQCNAPGVYSFDGPGYQAEVVIGWSRQPSHPEWPGGRVNGTLAPGGSLGSKIVADPPLAGLEANARPDPNDIPNNHLSYAVQWFLFALTASVIYAVAVWRRMASGGAK